MEKNFFRRMMDKLFGTGDATLEKKAPKHEPPTGSVLELTSTEGSNLGWVSVDKNTQNIEKSKAAELGNYSSEQLLRMAGYRRG